MCMSRAPLFGMHADYVPAAEPVISRELLRNVCEPFFEQMLTALQQALQQQALQQQPQQIPQTMTQATKDASFQSVFSSTLMAMHQRTQLDAMPDDESTEADEVGAFASLLSGPSSEGEAIDVIEDKLYESEAVSPLAQSSMPSEDSEPNDPEKSIMVCRHWRSKGWCRLQADCKFLHPENKCGVTAPKAGNGTGNHGGCIKGAACPSLTLSNMIGQEGEVLPRRRKRGGRGKSFSAQQVQLDSVEQEVSHVQVDDLLAFPLLSSQITQ